MVGCIHFNYDECYFGVGALRDLIDHKWTLMMTLVSCLLRGLAGGPLHRIEVRCFVCLHSCTWGTFLAPCMHKGVNEII